MRGMERACSRRGFQDEEKIAFKDKTAAEVCGLGELAVGKSQFKKMAQAASTGGSLRESQGPKKGLAC